VRLKEFLTYTHGMMLLWFLAHPACAQPLEQLIAIALASHPSAQAQTALVQSSQYGVDSARWQYYPTPSLSIEAAGTSGNDTLYQGNNRVAIARLQQPLWTGGRLAAGVDKAAAGLTASQASLDEVKLQLNSAFWLRIGQARPSCGRSKCFYMG
jgi:adhesin transport system outer membrane protein